MDERIAKLNRPLRLSRRDIFPDGVFEMAPYPPKGGFITLRRAPMMVGLLFAQKICLLDLNDTPLQMCAKRILARLNCYWRYQCQ